VGGMERYVWELTHGLVNQGVNIAVVCEQVLGEPDKRIRIERIDGKIPAKPRWKAMLRFRDQVDEILSSRFARQHVIVHSHERTINHHLTTFHGPPFTKKTVSFFRRMLEKLSPRRRAWLTMERDELLGHSVRVVIAVSELAKKDLIAIYPALAAKRIFVGWPGVYANAQLVKPAAVMFSGTKFLFVGKEWRRKGLDKAIQVIRRWRKNHQLNAVLDIFGPDPAEIKKRYPNVEWINPCGFSQSIPWADYDALIHLATKEPFGMVVAEARQNGLPVLVSDFVGAGSNEFGFKGVIRVGSADSLSLVDAKLTELVRNKEFRSPEVVYQWKDLVEMHVSKVYPVVLGSSIELWQQGAGHVPREN
jgi:UDP-glucose:(heptosyl)LPS alpha-1,3-glucosyltransferase